MNILEGKKVVIIGDKEGIPAPIIEDCIKSINAQVVFSATQCLA